MESGLKDHSTHLKEVKESKDNDFKKKKLGHGF